MKIVVCDRCSAHCSVDDTKTITLDNDELDFCEDCFYSFLDWMEGDDE